MLLEAQVMTELQEPRMDGRCWKRGGNPRRLETAQASAAPEAAERTQGWRGSQRVRVLPGEGWVGVSTARDLSVSHQDQVKPQRNSPRQLFSHSHPDLKSSCGGRGWVSGLPSEEKAAVASKTEGQAGCWTFSLVFPKPCMHYHL